MSNRNLGLNLGVFRADPPPAAPPARLLYTAQGKYNLAETHHRQAIEIRRSRLGAVHALVAQSLEHYGLLLTEMGRMNEAQRAQTLAASIRARAAEANRVKVEDGAPRSKPAVKKIVTRG